MKLYEMPETYDVLLEALDGAESDDQKVEILQQIDKLESDFTAKAGNYAKAMKNLEAQADAMREEARRLTAAARGRENTVAWLKNQMYEAMHRMGLKKVETEIGRWSTRINPPSVQIIDEDAIPAAYRIPQPDKIDKAAILTAYKTDGECVPGTEVSRSEGVTFK